MSRMRLYLVIAALIGPSLLGSTTARAAACHLGTNLVGSARIEIGKEEQKNSARDRDKEDRDDDNDKANQTGTPVVVLETDLVANLPTLVDRNGIVHAAHVVDPNLVNPWGVTESGASPFWVSDNNAGLATLYNTTGITLSLIVSIPNPGDVLTATGTATGAVFNTDGVRKEDSGSPA